jgi:DHA1 family tetracycline resistance protein-like MFS transporter
MALSPTLTILYITRAINGLTGSSMTAANAYVADVTPPEKRAAGFGMIGAAFGMGFIVGPVLGGTLGDHGLWLPFMAAAVLNAFNLLLAFFMLPESRTPTREPIDLKALNPLRPLRWVFSAKSLLPVTLIFFAFSAAGEVYGTCWALWGSDAFQWNGLWIGLSLGAFGVCQTLAQAFVPGPAVRLLGERATILTGVAAACVALIVMAFATQAWMIFAVMPVFALGGIGAPALQSLATRQVDESQQGEFQGVLASAVSLASIVCPLAFSSIYFGVRAQWPGAIWLSALVVYAIVVPLVLGLRFTRPVVAPTV